MAPVGEDGIREDGRVYPYLSKLAACLCEKLADYGFSELCFCGVVSGDVVDMTPIGSDDDSAMGWVRLVTIQPVSDDIVGQSCQVRLLAQFEVGFASCYPLQADPLTDAEQLNLARTQMAGMQAALQAILCCRWTKGRKDDLILEAYTPLGPDGGVVGGSWNVLVEV